MCFVETGNHSKKRKLTIFLFITARVDDPDLSSFKPFFWDGLPKLSSGLFGPNPPRKNLCAKCVRIVSVRMTRYKSGISPTASSRIWRPTWLLFSKKKIMRNKEVPKGSMFMVYFYLHPYTKFQGNAGRYSIHGSIWAWSFVLKDEVVGCRNDACWVWKK